jgi:hypothetical protein
MRVFSYRLPYVCLLAFVVAVPFWASARAAAKPAPCSVVAKGWEGRVTGRKLAPTHAAVERRVIELVNGFRRRHGLPPLKLDPGLRYAARARAVMDAKPEARMALYSPSTCIADDVAREHGLSRAASIVRSWRGDPGQRRVLLLPWARRVGVGVRVAGFRAERVTVVTALVSAARATYATPPRGASEPGPADPLPSVPVPAVATVALPPVIAPPPPAPAPNGPVVGVPYICNGPVNGLRVVGSGSDSRALIILDAGCTGTLSFDIRVTSAGGDGVKVQAGAHDISIGPSRIVCDPPSNSSFHQDGVQVQGGSNVTFSGLSVICPHVTGQGAAAFYIDGKDFGGISNVVCDGCDLEHLHYGALFAGPAPGSGVRNSIIHQGEMTGGYFRKVGDPAAALDSNNTLAPACDGAGLPC